MTNAYRNGAEQFKERILGKRQQIDADFAELARLDQTATVRLKTSERLAKQAAMGYRPSQCDGSGAERGHRRP